MFIFQGDVVAVSACRIYYWVLDVRGMLNRYYLSIYSFRSLKRELKLFPISSSTKPLLVHIHAVLIIVRQWLTPTTASSSL
jgi:hypothetical protein